MWSQAAGVLRSDRALGTPSLLQTHTLNHSAQFLNQRPACCASPALASASNHLAISALPSCSYSPCFLSSCAVFKSTNLGPAVWPSG